MVAQWVPVVLTFLLALLAGGLFFGGLNRGQADLKERIAGVDADLKERIAGVKADVGAMEARIVAMFADQLRDQRRDVADMRERVSALEAGS